MVCRCNIFLRAARSNARTAVTSVRREYRTEPRRRRSGVHGVRLAIEHAQTLPPKCMEVRLSIEEPGSGVIFDAVQFGAIIPFPLARRRAFIDRHARLIATMKPEAGERYLDRQLQIQFENL